MRLCAPVIHRRTLLALALLALSPAAALARTPAAPVKTAVDAALSHSPELRSATDDFFEERIRPVLANNCFGCHGAAAQQAGLRLDSLQAMLKGGADGKPVLHPGNVDGSALIQAVRYQGDIKMPPSGKLAPAAIADLEQWVKMGGAWPTAKPAVHQHWAFVPVKLPALPAVQHSSWVLSPVDRFVLARLEHAGMQPAPPADRRTLLRRVTYDLTGLPPTAAEVDAFVNDHRPDAYARVVDRLLASRQYGERWGRYWLDVARYADDKGYVFNEDRAYPWAYTYRDWVIRAFNDDMPYDRFIQCQLAADQLPGAKRSDLAALGFLTVGRRFLNQQPDIIADRIDTVSRGFMALTVGCARCHDHKYDPIPTQDYYSMYGIFASSMEPKDPPVISPPAVVEAYNLYASELKNRQDAVAAYQKAHDAELKAKDPTATAALAALTAKVDSWKKTPALEPEHAMVMQDLPTPVQQAVFIRGNAGRPGEPAPRRFLRVIAGPNPPLFTHGSGRLDLANAIADPNNPLTARALVNRVWLHHFGAGLVRTPADFGTRADPPTHPELLDYLAWRFVHEGWSVKKLQRWILLSQTYQQSSDDSHHYGVRDPENRMLWHMTRQRLDFEGLRDTLLAVSDQLDPQSYGKSVDVTVAPYPRRRTVYAYIERQNLPGVFRTFDFASPDLTTQQRTNTTVPQQALFFLNNPFCLDAARHLSALPAIASQSNPAARIQALYRQVYGRWARPDEVAMGLQFVVQAAAHPSSGPGAVSASAAWHYGWGSINETAGTVNFHVMPHWTGEAWQGGDALPDPTIGWATLNSRGGHPGNDQDHAVIRRWVAPVDAVLDIRGKLTHPEMQGDGVRARVVLSGKGILGTWTAHASSAVTRLHHVSVHKGDTLDFVVDCLGTVSFDSFTWTPALEREQPPAGARLAITPPTVQRAQPPAGLRLATTSPTVQRVSPPAGTRPSGHEADDELPNLWDAATDFQGPLGSSSTLSPWDQYAQVLLMTNELAFVD